MKGGGKGRGRSGRKRGEMEKSKASVQLLAANVDFNVAGVGGCPAGEEFPHDNARGRLQSRLTRVTGIRYLNLAPASMIVCLVRLAFGDLFGQSPRG